MTRVGPLALPLVAARHLVRDRRDRLRGMLWGDRLGYEPRLPSPNRVDLIEPARWERGSSRLAAGPGSAAVGVLEADSALAACAGFLGLKVEAGGHEGWSRLLERALAGGWALVASSGASLAGMPDEGWALAESFVRRGGVLFLAEVGPGPGMMELTRRLSPAPVQAEPPPARSTRILFPAGAADFAGLLGGVALDTSVQGAWLRGAARPLALALSGPDRLPTVLEMPVGEGRVILSSYPASLPAPLRSCLGAELSPVFGPAMMALKQVYGAAGWHAPAVLANFTVDDPALREGLLGFPYSRAVGLAREAGFHVTVATIPAELGLAEPSVLSQLRQHPLAVSACYHGWNHDGYEFYRSSGRRLRFRVRSLERQTQALRQAADAGRGFARRTGCALDRVMVFPHGLGPAAILRDLQRLGFLASCNLDNRYPLEAELPDDPWLCVRPADTAWEGFPLLWRREIGDPAYALDLFVGRPALSFEHRPGLGPDLRPFSARAQEIHRLTGGRAAWRSLEEVARHAYLQRRDPATGWHVLMTANEACLHNPDSAPRSYRILRPHLPAGSAWEAEGAGGEIGDACGEGCCVTVPAGGAVTVRLRGDGPSLPVRQAACSLFPG